MNKGELIGAVASEANLNKAQAQAAVDALVGTIQAAMKSGEKVTLVGFGTFAASNRPARTGRNPQTGATIQISARKVPKFTPGKALKDAIQ